MPQSAHISTIPPAHSIIAVTLSDIWIALLTCQTSPRQTDQVHWVFHLLSCLGKVDAVPFLKCCRQWTSRANFLVKVKVGLQLQNITADNFSLLYLVGEVIVQKFVKTNHKIVVFEIPGHCQNCNFKIVESFKIVKKCKICQNKICKGFLNRQKVSMLENCNDCTKRIYCI